MRTHTIMSLWLYSSSVTLMVSSSEPGKWEPHITESQLATSAAHETAREILVTLLSIYVVPDIFKALGKHYLSH